MGATQTHLTLTEYLVIKIINDENEKCMNARELRIGNLINGSFDSPITVDYVKLMWLEKNDHEITASWKPIPLTEEWLIKFGFEKKERNQFGGKKFIYSFNTSESEGVELNEHFQFLYANGRKIINYVHQLQNLFFALTGKELNLNHDTERT